MERLALIGIIAVSANCWAQNTPPPITAKRTAAPQAQQDASAIQNRVKSDLDALREDPLSNVSGLTPSPTQIPSAEGVPAGFKPNTDLTLTPSAEAAVNVSEKWLRETMAPAPGPDGRVLYSYGAGLPTVVCAPLRVCTVELQSG